MKNHSLNILKCPLCQNTELDRLFQANDYISLDPFIVYRCAHCDLAITDLGLINKNISDYYGGGYYGQRKFLVESIINYARVRAISRIKDFAPSFSLLDVGCGNGTFLMSMRKRGWQSFGTEIAPAGHIQQCAGEFIKKGDFRKSDFSGNSFDVITMWHSLEHVEDPLGYLIEAERVLKDNGVLVAEIPNFRSLQAIIFRKNWFHLDVPRHLFHFSPKSAGILFQKAGFNKVKIKNGSFIYGLFGCLQSALNVFSGRKNLFFDILNSKISFGCAYKDHKRDVALNTVLFIPALFFSILLFLAEIITGNNGIILVSARKIQNNALKCFNCGNKNSYIVFPATADVNNIFKSNSYKITDSVSGKYNDIYKCFSCGIYFIDRDKLAIDFDRYYSGQCLDNDYIEDEMGRRKAFNKALVVIKNIQREKNIKLLDIGCGPGFFLAEAQKNGFEVYGLEPSLEGCGFARKNLKLKNIVCGSAINLDGNFHGNFDVISAFDVIEHVLDPIQFLKNINKKLNPEGLVVITTPLIDSLFAKLLGNKWYALIPSHLTYFTGNSFEDICESLGFVIIYKRYHTKYLSLNYLIRRLFKKQDVNLPKFMNFIIPINFYDEAEFYLKKKI
ncbi:MAG: class I SAM-dependent methyltransferase [Patescibacteria group bacterium]